MRLLRPLLALLLTLLIGLNTSWAIGIHVFKQQSPPTTGTISALNANGTTGQGTSGSYVSVALPGALNQVAVDVEGTYVGQLAFQQTVDGTHWYAIPTVNIVNATSNAAGAISANGTGIFNLNASGLVFRVVTTAYTSGTPTVTIIATLYQYQPPSSGGAGSVTQGTNPWVVGGNGTAGSAASGVLTVQGIASMTALTVSAATWPLPTGAATSANQATLNTLINGGLPAALGSGGGLKIDGSGTSLPVTLSTLIAGEDLTNNVLATTTQYVNSSTYAPTQDIGAALATHETKAIAGNVIYYHVLNHSATVVYFQLWNGTSAGSGTLVDYVAVPAAVGSIDGDVTNPPWGAQGLYCSTGITWAFSSTPTTYTSLTATGLNAFVGYK